MSQNIGHEILNFTLVGQCRWCVRILKVGLVGLQLVKPESKGKHYPQLVIPPILDPPVFSVQ